MGIQTTGKRNNRFRSSKKIRNFFTTGIPLIGEIFWSNVTAKSEFTYITVINFFVLVCYLLAGYVVFMVALLLGKLFFQMLIGMQRLEQHGEQYCNNQRKTYYEFILFHSSQR